MSTHTTMPEGQQLIGGDWVEGAGTIDDLDPGNGELIAVVAHGDTSQLDLAVTAAQAAAPRWAALAPAARAAYLLRVAAILEPQVDEWAELVTREMGKPRAEAVAEARRTLRILHYYAGEAERPMGEHFASERASTWVFTRREPVGVVGVITPWNFPAAIPAWKIAPAMVFGNTVVMKLADDAPLSGLWLARAFQDAGLPEGVLNVMLGDGELGAALVTHPGIDAVTFTGSTAVGLRIVVAAAPLQKKVQLELGGHNPVIVCADADLGNAVESVFQGAFASTGQKCTATRRVYVEEPLMEPFIDALVARTRSTVIGYGLDPGVEIGPIVNERQFGGVLDAVEVARQAGTIVAGGGRLTDGPLGSGFFMEPTIVTDLPASAQLARDEIFGPVVGVWGFSSFEEAVTAANDTQYGLSAAVFTRDLDTAKRFVEGVSAGVVRVNAQTAGIEPHVPLGGWGASGYGYLEQGRSAIDFFTHLKTVYFNPSA